LNTRISRAHYRSSGAWQLESEAGEVFEFDIVINAMGNQHTPLFPDVEGMDTFEGESWHGTRWNHEVDLTGKRIALIGSAASAVQIVPQVAKVAGHLTVLQRTANWIMPRRLKQYSERRRRWFRRLPFLIKATRWIQGLLLGQVEYAATLGHKRMGQFERMAQGYIDSSFSDPAMREVLTPSSRYACKRGLVSDDFYAALNRDNVELVASGLERVTPTGIITEAGRSIDVDIIIYCTGYRLQDFDRIDVVGASGRSLAEVMADDPKAFKGISVPDFPNYFFAVGPNGLVLNVSYFITAEKNVESIVRLLKDMRSTGAGQMVVKLGEFDSYNDWMAPRFPKFSWGAADCTSYYRNASGHAPFLFPGNFKEYSQQHAEISLQDYELS
jgi:cyclohexanone monooxygenase